MEKLLKKSVNKGGRPKYVPTDKDRNIVRMMAGFGIPQEKICLAIDVSPMTLRRDFKKEIKTGAAQVEAQLVGNLLNLANGKDGTAFRAAEFLLNCRFGWSRYAPPPVHAEPELGKKQQLVLEAQTGHENTEWGNLLN